MRRKPPSKPPAVTLAPNNNQVTQARTYKVITPLYGGGAETYSAEVTKAGDAVTIIRGSSIRGQLRFWWRATRGGAFDGDHAKMKAAEDAIWGAAATKDGSGQSQVMVNVVVQNEGSEFRPTDNRGRSVQNIGDVRSKDSYAAFPLRDTQGATVLEDVAFELHIAYPQTYADDLQAALWAWETFGGIGARTRRGFGALACTHVNGATVTLPAIHQAEATIRQGLAQHVTAGHWPDTVPNVGKGVRLRTSERGNQADSIDIWRYLVNKLQQFRQDRNGRYGSSNWPEAHSIRRMTKQHAPKQQPRSGPNLFPRGQMGLPIVFQFKDSDRGDPEQVILKGEEHDRLASPLILRPLLCANDTAIGIALVLDAPNHPPGEKLALQIRDNDRPVEGRVTDAQARNIPPLDGTTDVLQAFLETL